MTVEFKPWPKIPRYKGSKVCITEKMDGTNACIVIKDGELYTQSRNQLITPEQDNYGFAKWCQDNKQELLKLGDGYHYGEWVGLGIQSNPHNLDNKYFYLFNVKRWGNHNPNTPNCCRVVRILHDGDLTIDTIENTMKVLLVHAETNNYTPEGVVIYDKTADSYQKLTFKNTEGKWKN